MISLVVMMRHMKMKSVVQMARTAYLMKRMTLVMKNYYLIQMLMVLEWKLVRGSKTGEGSNIGGDERTFGEINNHDTYDIGVGNSDDELHNIHSYDDEQ